MALLQSVNPDASMAAGDDIMEYSTEGRSPMIEDDLDIDADVGGGLNVHDQDMGDGAEGASLVDDDEMADGDGAQAGRPTITVTGGDGHDLDLDDAGHAADGDSSPKESATAPTDVAKTEVALASADPNGDGLEDANDAQTLDAAQGDGHNDAEEEGEEEDEEEVHAEEPAEESDDESPPPRRPAGKGPAGRAPQKTPAFTASTAEDPLDDSSHDSEEEDSQDEDNEQAAAHPTTTEPSFTDSAKAESESEEESDEGEAAVPMKQPAYHETPSDSDSESLVDHGPVHSIIVDYQGSKISLFPPQPDHEEQESYLLQDEGLCHEPIARMLSECRTVLRETLLDDEELLLSIPCLGVSISEQIAETMSITMTELVDLFLQLSYNDGVSAPSALRVTLDTKEKCKARIDLIRRMIGEGKGLSHVLAHLDGSSAHAAPLLPSKLVGKDAFAAAEDDSAPADARSGPSANATSAFVPAEPQDFEDQFDVQTPGVDDADPLGGTVGAAANDPDFLDFTSPEKHGKSVAEKDPSNFDDVFDGDFGAADSLLDSSGAGPSGMGLSGQDEIGAFGSELNTGEFTDGFSATNNSGGLGSLGMGTGGDQHAIPPVTSDGIGTGGYEMPLPSADAAQAAEDEFTFMETSGDGANDAVVTVGEAGEEHHSPVGVKRSRPDDDATLPEIDNATGQPKRARAA